MRWHDKPNQFVANAIANAEPDNLRWQPAKQAALQEIGVLPDDGESMMAAIVPDLLAHQQQWRTPDSSTQHPTSNAPPGRASSIPRNARTGSMGRWGHRWGQSSHFAFVSELHFRPHSTVRESDYFGLLSKASSGAEISAHGTGDFGRLGALRGEVGTPGFTRAVSPIK